MSGWWIVLHDTRVRVDAQNDRDNALNVISALQHLYDVCSIPNDDFCLHDMYLYIIETEGV